MRRRDDWELVARFQEGDERAFDELLAAYKDDVYNIVKGMVDDSTWAEDLTAEALIEVYRSLNGFRFGASFRTWLYRIVVNVCVQGIRRKRRKRQIVEVALTEEMADGSPGPWDVVSAKESAKMVARAISDLPARLRMTMLLYYVGDMTCPEIAKALRIPVATAKSRVLNGTKRVRERVRGEVGP